MAEKKPLCDFGKQIEIALIQKDKTNDWLIEKVKEDTGRYFDRSYLFKVKTGKLETPGIKKSICRILNIQDSGACHTKNHHTRWNYCPNCGAKMENAHG